MPNVPALKKFFTGHNNVNGARLTKRGRAKNVVGHKIFGYPIRNAHIRCQLGEILVFEAKGVHVGQNSFGVRRARNFEFTEYTESSRS